MTPKQKQLKLENIISLINTTGFIQDHYGNYKCSFKDTDYRIKIKKINIRIESKQSGTKLWYKITSQPITKINLTEFATFISRFLK